MFNDYNDDVIPWSGAAKETLLAAYVGHSEGGEGGKYNQAQTTAESHYNDAALCFLTNTW